MARSQYCSSCFIAATVTAAGAPVAGVVGRRPSTHSNAARAPEQKRRNSAVSADCSRSSTALYSARSTARSRSTSMVLITLRSSPRTGMRPEFAPRLLTQSSRTSDTATPYPYPPCLLRRSHVGRVTFRALAHQQTEVARGRPPPWENRMRTLTRVLPVMILMAATLLWGGNPALAYPPTPPGVTTTRAHLAELTVAPARPMTGYS